jgi:hypothetical protein
MLFYFADKHQQQEKNQNIASMTTQFRHSKPYQKYPLRNDDSKCARQDGTGDGVAHKVCSSTHHAQDVNSCH